MPMSIMPPHRGYLTLIRVLLKDYKKIVFVIGSRFEMGTPEHCITADDRRKMLLAMLTEAKVSQSHYDITCMSDYEKDEDWYQDLLGLCMQYDTNVVATGNDLIIKLAEEKGGIVIENPKVPTKFECQSTLVLEALIEKDFGKLIKLVPLSVLQIMFSGKVYEEIVASYEGKAKSFIPGRQTVDVILLVKDSKSQDMYVLLGRRDLTKKDFPGKLALPGGGIDDHEFAIDAAIRELEEETGLKINLLAYHLPTTVITLDNVDTKKFLTMKMVGLYGSTDEKIAGTLGGSSQVYTIYTEDDIDKYKLALSANSDLYNIGFYEVEEALRAGLAYQHGDMIKDAISMV